MELERLRRNCELNRFAFDVVENKEECLELVKKLIHENDVVSVGGSVTLTECGILEHLENRKDIQYLDRYHCEDVQKLFRDTFFADVYLTSSNAITMKGELYNVDGTGNRVAAMCFGPKKVLVIVGKNKIVENLDDAIKRVEEIAAPRNNMRLNKPNPCVQTGHCVHCKSETKICHEFVVISSCRDLGRIHIIVVNENLGY